MDWYSPLIYSSDIVVGIYNESFQKLDEASISNHIPIQNLLAQLEKSINQAITPEDIEIKIKFDPAVMLIANESNAGSVITYASLETDWLDGSIISR